MLYNTFVANNQRNIVKYSLRARDIYYYIYIVNFNFLDA